MATKKSAPLDPKVADKLLDLLSTDNAFRRLFKKDPLAALAQVGHQESKAALAAMRKGATPESPAAPLAGGCLQVTRIAPKEQIVRARAELKEMLTVGLSFTPPQLDASIAASRRARK